MGDHRARPPICNDASGLTLIDRIGTAPRHVTKVLTDRVISNDGNSLLDDVDPSKVKATVEAPTPVITLCVIVAVESG